MGPVWLIGDWRNRHGAVTFPLASGGRSTGPGGRRFPYGGVTFAPQPWLPQRYYHSTAVDPRLTPLSAAAATSRLPPHRRLVHHRRHRRSDQSPTHRRLLRRAREPGSPRPLHDAPADPSDPTRMTAPVQDKPLIPVDAEFVLGMDAGQSHCLPCNARAGDTDRHVPVRSRFASETLAAALDTALLSRLRRHFVPVPRSPAKRGSRASRCSGAATKRRTDVRGALAARSEAGPLPAEILVAGRKRVRLTTRGRYAPASPCLEASALLTRR
jgi:hypothetical protein